MNGIPTRFDLARAFRDFGRMANQGIQPNHALKVFTNNGSNDSNSVLPMMTNNQRARDIATLIRCGWDKNLIRDFFPDIGNIGSHTAYNHNNIGSYQWWQLSLVMADAGANPQGFDD